MAEIEEDINCDLCNEYQPVRFCEVCGIDWCKRCEITHNEVHREVGEATAMDIDGGPAI